MKRREEIDEMEEKIVEALGWEMAFTELSKALDYATKADMYEYIMRMHDLNEY